MMYVFLFFECFTEVLKRVICIQLIFPIQPADQTKGGYCHQYRCSDRTFITAALVEESVRLIHCAMESADRCRIPAGFDTEYVHFDCINIKNLLSTMALWLCKRRLMSYDSAAKLEFVILT